MDTENLHNLRAIAPSTFEGELRLFRDFDPARESGASVPDPYYGGARGLRRRFGHVRTTSDGLIAYLKEIVSSKPNVLPWPSMKAQAKEEL